MAHSVRAQIAPMAGHPNQAPECIQPTDPTTLVKHAAFLCSRLSRPPSQSELQLRPRTPATPEHLLVRCNRQPSDIPSGLTAAPPWPPLARLPLGEIKPWPGARPGTIKSAKFLPPRSCRTAAEIHLLAPQV